jgi:hypothetical protein
MSRFADRLSPPGAALISGEGRPLASVCPQECASCLTLFGPNRPSHSIAVRARSGGRVTTDRRRFLSGTVLGLNGAFLAHCTRLAAAEKFGGERKAEDRPNRSRTPLDPPAGRVTPLRQSSGDHRSAAASTTSSWPMRSRSGGPYWTSRRSMALVSSSRLMSCRRISAALESIVQADTIKGGESLGQV